MADILDSVEAVGKAHSHPSGHRKFITTMAKEMSPVVSGLEGNPGGWGDQGAFLNFSDGAREL